MREKPPARSSKFPRFKFLLFALVGLVAASFFFLLYSPLRQAAYLKLEHIQVQGQARLSQEEVARLSGVKLGDNLLKVNPREVETRLKQDPWIKDALVRVILPGRLVISITERKPAALVKIDYLFYLDQEGRPFKPVQKGDNLDYPVITGVPPNLWKENQPRARQMTKEALEFLKEVQDYPFPSPEEISEVNINPSYGVTFFTLANGLEIRMGTAPYQEKLRRLNRVLKMKPKELGSAQYIDITYQGQVVFGHSW